MDFSGPPSNFYGEALQGLSDIANELHEIKLSPGEKRLHDSPASYCHRVSGLVFYLMPRIGELVVDSRNGEHCVEASLELERVAELIGDVTYALHQYSARYASRVEPLGDRGWKVVHKAVSHTGRVASGILGLSSRSRADGSEPAAKRMRGDSTGSSSILQDIYLDDWKPRADAQLEALLSGDDISSAQALRWLVDQTTRLPEDPTDLFRAARITAVSRVLSSNGFRVLEVFKTFSEKDMGVARNLLQTGIKWANAQHSVDFARCARQLNDFRNAFQLCSVARYSSLETSGLPHSLWVELETREELSFDLFSWVKPENWASVWYIVSPGQRLDWIKQINAGEVGLLDAVGSENWNEVRAFLAGASPYCRRLNGLADWDVPIDDLCEVTCYVPDCIGLNIIELPNSEACEKLFQKFPKLERLSVEEVWNFADFAHLINEHRPNLKSLRLGVSAEAPQVQGFESLRLIGKACPGIESLSIYDVCGVELTPDQLAEALQSFTNLKTLIFEDFRASPSEGNFQNLLPVADRLTNLRMDQLPYLPDLGFTTEEIPVLKNLESFGLTEIDSDLNDQFLHWIVDKMPNLKELTLAPIDPNEFEVDIAITKQGLEALFNGLTQLSRVNLAFVMPGVSDDDRDDLLDRYKGIIKKLGK